MAFSYKHVLMIGATSGIGQALASRLIREGSSVTVVGRRQDRLDSFVKEHGNDKARGIAFDIGDISAIPQFAQEVTKDQPELDCVFINAGVQARYNFSKPETVDLKGFHQEMSVNFSSFVALTHAFLPHLLSKPSSSLVYTGSNLAIVPASPLPAYSASKAALNAFVLCLRAQLSNTSVKVIEVSPPPVQTELHDKEMGTDAGRKLGMPLDQFTDAAYNGLAAGKDQIVVGSIGLSETFNEIIDKRRGLSEFLTKMMTQGQVPSTK